MKIHEQLQLTVLQLYNRTPAWVEAVKVWGWWAARKALLYGTCYYILETLLGHRRRRLGASPLRSIGIDRWLPRTVDKELDESTRAMLQHLGYQVLDDDQRLPIQFSEKSNFYADIEYPISTAPLPDDDPPPPVEGDTYPLGYLSLMKTLRVLGHFPPHFCVEVLKSCTIKFLHAGEQLVNFGEVDSSFHVVVSGSLSIFIKDVEFGIQRIKSVLPNEHIMSIFSIVSVVLGVTVPPKPIQVIADEESIVMEVPLDAIAEYYWTSNRSDLELFIMRSLRKIRSLYFEGLTEVAGLNRQLMRPAMGESGYESFELDLNNPEELNKVIDEATEGLRQHFSLNEDDLKECTIAEVKGGSAVTRMGLAQKSVIYIHKGELVMVNESPDSRYRKMTKDVKDGRKFIKFSQEYFPVFYQPRGTIIGSWSLITNSINYFTSMVPKEQKAIIVEIPQHVVHRGWKRDPARFFTFIEQMIARWSDFSKKIDFCMQWGFSVPGKVVYRRGDPNIATFLVLNGRLRYRVLNMRRMELESKNQFGYYEHGDWFGFVECAVGAKSMQKTVVADRYSEIVILPKGLITLLHRKFRHVTSVMTGYLAMRIHREYNYDEVTPLKYRNQEAMESLLQPKYAMVKRWHTQILAIIPLSSEIPTYFYCTELCKHYPRKSLLLTYEEFRKYNDYNEDKENINRLSEWISPYTVKEVSEDLGMIIFVGNVDKVDLWNTFIVRQADFVQILATTKCRVKPQDIELMVQKEGWKAIKDFTFLHPAVLKYPKIHKGEKPGPPRLYSPLPSGSVMWLNQRPWLDTHHHVRFIECAFRIMIKKGQVWEFEEYEKKVGFNKHCDVARISRWLADTMVGMVLGGGGAKGAAHLGVLECWQQLDLPLDYICGVSIGSFVGGLLALHQDLTQVERHLRRLFHELEKPTRYLSDLTVPYSSLFGGRSFDEFVQNSFSDIRIEDLWVPYFCVTTDITGRHSRAHKHGLMWFYVRASMTLTMIFPPLVNPRDLHLLMDGGYSEILPGNHLRANGVRYILASDIGDENGIPLFNIGYECSGIKCVLQNMFPINHWPPVPSRLQFMEQLNYIAARKYVQLMKKKDRRLVFIRPAVEFYTGKDFHKVDEIKMMGFYTTKKRIGIVRRGLSVRMMWTMLNTHLHDYETLAARAPGEKYKPKPIEDEEGDPGDGEEIQIPDSEMGDEDFAYR